MPALADAPFVDFLDPAVEADIERQFAELRETRGWCAPLWGRASSATNRRTISWPTPGSISSITHLYRLKASPPGGCTTCFRRR